MSDTDDDKIPPRGILAHQVEIKRKPHHASIIIDVACLDIDTISNNQLLTLGWLRMCDELERGGLDIEILLNVRNVMREKGLLPRDGIDEGEEPKS